LDGISGSYILEHALYGGCMAGIVDNEFFWCFGWGNEFFLLILRVHIARRGPIWVERVGA
jgi:hypothetical protein